MNARRDRPITVEPMLPPQGFCPPRNGGTEEGAQTVERYQEGQRS